MIGLGGLGETAEQREVCLRWCRERDKASSGKLTPQ